MRVVGPNSYGVVNADPRLRLNASLAPRLPEPGRLALFCQSGRAQSGSSLDGRRRSRGLGLSTFVSAGNRADVSGNDCMQYWEEDVSAPPSSASTWRASGNPRKFSRIARRLARRQAGDRAEVGCLELRRSAGHRAARPSHAPAGAFDAMLQQSGCIRVETVHELFDVAAALCRISRCRRARGSPS